MLYIGDVILIPLCFFENIPVVSILGLGYSRGTPGPSSSLADQLAGWHPEARDRRGTYSASKPLAVCIYTTTMNEYIIQMYGYMYDYVFM